MRQLALDFTLKPPLLGYTFRATRDFDSLEGLDLDLPADLDRRIVTAGFVGHNRDERTGEHFRWSATVQAWRVRAMLDDYNRTGPLVWLETLDTEQEHDQ